MTSRHEIHSLFTAYLQLINRKKYAEKLCYITLFLQHFWVVVRFSNVVGAQRSVLGAFHMLICALVEFFSYLSFTDAGRMVIIWQVS